MSRFSFLPSRLVIEMFMVLAVVIVYVFFSFLSFFSVFVLDFIWVFIVFCFIMSDCLFSFFFHPTIRYKPFHRIVILFYTIIYIKKDFV